MDEFIMCYREVIPDQTNPEEWKDIILNTGGTQSTLQDIKVAEKAGGYSYKDFLKNHNRNRFIYWRTFHDVLELSEISLDLNLYENNVRFKFTDSPVLSVSICEQHSYVYILVATVCSIHRLQFQHPDKIHKQDISNIKAYSIFHNVSARDSSIFHLIGQTASSNHPIPHTASCCLFPNSQDALFTFAYQTSVMLYTMNCATGATTAIELKENYIMPRIFSNIKGALRGKSASNDNQYATSLLFDCVGGQTFLYGLYRDDIIRMWSTKTGQLVASFNCNQEGMEARPQGPQVSTLRKASPTTICAFLCYATDSQFMIIQTSWSGNSDFVLKRTNTIIAPQYDLIDFELVDSKIWGLWCNSQGEVNISSYCLTTVYGQNWLSAALEPPPDRYSISIEHGMDPRQAYCSYIFHPGKFQRHIIAKALVMFRRSNIYPDANLSIAILRDRVCQAVETEIQNEIKDYELNDEEYIEISTRFWEKFYSCCEQYHLKSTQPIGLLLMESESGVCIIKKNAFSLLRPCEALEHLMLSGDNSTPEQLMGTQLGNNQKLCSDLVQIIQILTMIEHQISDDIKNDIDKKLYQLQMPNIVVSKLVKEMLSKEYDETEFPQQFLISIRQKMESIIDLPSAMILLLDSLRMDHGDPQAMQTHSNVAELSRTLLTIGHLFGSNLGISFVSESLRQISLIRYSLCRNLLILQHILIDTFALSCNILEVIRSRCMPETVVFVQAYYVMVWLSETPASAGTTTTSIDNSIQRLSLIQLSDTRQYINRPQQATSLLEMFLRAKGSHTAITLLAEGHYRHITDPQWQFSLLPLVTIVGQLVWAVSGNFIFGEWLIGSCQHILIQEYVRLLNTWCEWNNCSRHFILAVSLLDNGEPHKAYDLFMQAAKGILSETFLNEKILSTLDDFDNITQSEAMAQYYLKVIPLFEQHLALDCVINLAEAAIGVLDNNDPQLAMFQSIVFSNHLALDHYEEAYHSLIYNVELSRRKDCLRQLIVCLFQQKRLDLLMHFPYIGLQDELENIIESRARSMSIDDNDYYDFLYSFHISKGNMRKASSIMYEQSMRYLLECDSIEAMNSRYNCLLVCINCLHLIDENYAWIAKPIINDDNHMSVDDDSIKTQVVVLEINDIKKELLLTEAIISLSNHKQDFSTILNTGPEELIAILSNCGLYTSAIKLAIGFNKSLVTIIESLTTACVYAVNQPINEPWSWLQENDLADLPIKNCAVDMAWSLLEKLLNEYEVAGESILRKCVTQKILNAGEFLPQWLYNSYKKINPSELLYLFVSCGRLIEATDLTKEYIIAMINSGIEYFDIKNYLSKNSPPLCLPVNTIDLLLLLLKENGVSDNEYKVCYKELKQYVDDYKKIAIRTSLDKQNMIKI